MGNVTVRQQKWDDTLVITKNCEACGVPFEDIREQHTNKPTSPMCISCTEGRRSTRAKPLNKGLPIKAVAARPQEITLHDMKGLKDFLQGVPGMLADTIVKIADK